MKTTGIIGGVLLILAGIALAVFLIIQVCLLNYHYTNAIGNYWTLADRASTVSQKSDYIDQFVTALQNSGLQGSSDALFFSTPENSFDQNLKALQSLQSRLHDIKTMDESSFAYQTAIQQITAQEQGQASDMLAVFRGCWTKVHYYYLWNGWVFFGLFLSIVFLWIAGGVMILVSKDNSYKIK